MTTAAGSAVTAPRPAARREPMATRREPLAASLYQRTFPVADLQSFGPQHAVEHSMYFEQDGTSEALLRWLAG